MDIDYGVKGKSRTAQARETVQTLPLILLNELHFEEPWDSFSSTFLSKNLDNKTLSIPESVFKRSKNHQFLKGDLFNFVSERHKAVGGHTTTIETDLKRDVIHNPLRIVSLDFFTDEDKNRLWNKYFPHFPLPLLSREQQLLGSYQVYNDTTLQVVPAHAEKRSFFLDLAKSVSDAFPPARVFSFVGMETNEFLANSLEVVADPSFKGLWNLQNQYDRERFAEELSYCTPGLPNEELNKRYRAVQKVVFQKGIRQFGGEQLDDLRDLEKGLDALAKGKPLEALNILASQQLTDATRPIAFTLALVDALDLDPFSARLVRCFSSVLDNPLHFKTNIREIASTVNEIGNSILDGTVSALFNDIELSNSFGSGGFN